MDQIFKRTSIRRYLDQPVEAEKTEYLLKAAMQAPSAGNQQPWEFYVITNRDILKKLSKISPYAGPAARAPIAIAAAVRNECEWPQVSDYDVSLAMGNMWLAAGDVGLGGVWLGVSPFKDRMDAVSEILNLPDSVRPFAILPMGTLQESLKRTTDPIRQKFTKSNNGKGVLRQQGSF